MRCNQSICLRNAPARQVLHDCKAFARGSRKAFTGRRSYRGPPTDSFNGATVVKACIIEDLAENQLLKLHHAAREPTAAISDRDDGDASIGSHTLGPGKYGSGVATGAAARRPQRAHRPGVGTRRGKGRQVADVGREDDFQSVRRERSRSREIVAATFLIATSRESARNR